MPPQDVDPVEKKSSPIFFFILGSLFLFVSIWAYYNEFVSRRSWKEYQREFNQLELKRVEDQYAQQKKEMNEDELRQIGLKIEQAEIQLEGPEAKRLQEELGRRKVRLSDAKQRFGFNKADQDEVYYEWKHAQEEGKDFEPYKKRYEGLAARLEELKQKVAEAQASVDEIQEKLNVYTDELEKWQKAQKKYYEPLEKLQKKIAAIQDRGLDIKQVVIEDLGRNNIEKWGVVDRCESCHVAINRDGFENEKNPFKTHPFRAEIFGKHPIEQFGCTTCHWGQGRATQIEGKPLEEGDHVHGFVHHIPQPLLRGDFVQSSCNKCHQDQWRLDHAPVYMQGKKLFRGLGCTGCHALKGFEDAPKVGPSLRKVGSKVDEQWLMAWIKNPRDYLPKTKMPTPPLDIEEPNQIEKVAAYILQESETFNFPYGKFPGGDAAAGKQLFETVGCIGCHTMGEKGTGLAAALDKIASKTSADWVFNWIQNPKAYNPNARMPSLRLSPKEAADITAYLMKQGTPPPSVDPALHATLHDPENAKKGFLIISQFGCYGCHEIKGFENAAKLSVDLSIFGRKDIVELDFGDTKVPHHWQDWAFGKIKNPRQYLTEKTSSKMPLFNLNDDQIHSLVVFLKGLRGEEVPDRYLMSKKDRLQPDIDRGRRMVDFLNCKGCHLIEGEGRLIEPFVPEGKAPPNLMGIGARVRPDWMFHFLKDPGRVKIRPWIDVRMPTFGFNDDQAWTVIKYFDYLHKYPADMTSPYTGTPDPQMAAIGAKLFSKDYFSCTSCHIANGQTPKSSPTQWGPDLAMVRERIRPEFIPPWLKNPQDFTPGVNMPAFLMSEDSGPPDILGGDEQKQAEALRDYLMTLGK